MGKWKQILLDEATYARLKDARTVLAKEEKRSVSFSDIVRLLIKRDLQMLVLDKDVRSYITEYVRMLSAYEGVLGIMLFGSVAKGTWTEYSDIDLFVVVDGNPLDYFHKTNQIDKKLDSAQRKLFSRGLSLYVSPLILDRHRLSEFRMIYLELLMDGVILYEKDTILSDFINGLKNSISYVKNDASQDGYVVWKNGKN